MLTLRSLVVIPVAAAMFFSCARCAADKPGKPGASEKKLEATDSPTESASNPGSLLVQEIVLRLDSSSQPAKQCEAEAPKQLLSISDALEQMRKKITELAMRFLGTPYRWGGTTPRAFDCSGFTRYVYKQIGKRLPRTAREQYKAGQPVSRGACLPGDLVFFDMRKGRVSHVGMYIGSGKFIHASTPKTGVRIDQLGKYRRQFVGARRFALS